MKIFTKSFLYLLICWQIIACSKESEYKVVEISNPFPVNTMFPNMYVQGNNLMLSYIHSQGDTLDQLFYSVYGQDGFNTPTKVAEGTDWFVNWADIPSIAFAGDNIITSWLDKSSEGAYDYDIIMRISNDNGNSWSIPFVPHKDGISAEHGFTSIEVDEKGNFHAIWLDGRNTKVLDENGKESHGQMTLRAAIISPDGTMTSEKEIDDRVCDCCQTAIKTTDLGTFAVYRDRSDGEIRDNYFSIFDENKWSEPKAIHNDNWKIAGCPVNGPVIDAKGENIAVSWYTEGSEKPSIFISKYDKEANSFGIPTLVSDQYVLGRSDLLVLENGKIMVTWLERNADNTANIKANLYSSTLELEKELIIGQTSAARSSGFPKIAEIRGKVVLGYTVVEPEIRLVTKLISSN